MKFDVIIGNPPYQMGSDGGTRDMPIYNKFVEQAKKLNPRFLSMIIPSRWMASGLGLSDFRRTMLEDRRIRKLVDYERMDEVFPGVDFEGGVCFFLWDRDNKGDCAVTTVRGDDVVGPVDRNLAEYDILVRDSRALKILRKVLSAGEASITGILSVDKEFGWTSNFDSFQEKRRPNDVALHYNRKGKRLIGGIDRKAVGKSSHLIDTWKVMVPAAYGERGACPAMVLGPSFIAGPHRYVRRRTCSSMSGRKRRPTVSAATCALDSSGLLSLSARSPSMPHARRTRGCRSRRGTAPGLTRPSTKNTT